MRRSVYLDNTIEFLRGRVYLGAYDYTPEDTDELVFFTVEDAIFYNSFHLDFGPMNIGHLYRFAVIFHEILNDPENANKAVVFYSSASTRQRANAACMLCCYMILVQAWTPHQVLQPLAQVDPPFMPFRDAGYSNADFEITIQDVVYGVWRAKEKGLIDLHSFNLESYEKYEHVEFGDFNVLTPDFIAFASPQEDHPKGHLATKSSHLNQPFRSVLNFFANNNVQLVVRLNSHLYNKKHFEDIGIQHLDLIFEDGTCPDLSIVKNFVGAAETIIKRGGKIAVHCKAGLGRTGCLIGAHLIYTYGFTANECIGFLRFIRPGMVVGPQQHWLYLHQNDFREWKYTTRISLKPSEAIGGLYPLISLEEYRLQKKKLKDDKRVTQNNIEGDLRDLTMTPPSNGRGAPSVRNSSQPSTANNGSNSFKSSAVPQTSPGQPRKGQNGSNTIEDINNNHNPTSHANRKVVIESNNSDDESMQDTNSISNHYPKALRKRNDISSASSSRMEDNETSAMSNINNAADDTILRQLLPKNRRVTSGRRTTSAAGGIRKISGSIKK
ncbi:phosphoprotein phosphatase CDC14 [Saccharomyces paradoxus]|uniref:Tyrosine-protein phosphatase CDC14 n=1 Tax=Saccharomyces paradoxus TaxID=27291 RepID=A0A8B8UQY7_SACPA|nr:Cdc14 [Saccharomyces paradoxus]QHS73059.1 Cdc14 [Saccharomyces paradoxus]